MEEIDLWFEGFVGIDDRIAISQLPKKFSHEAWEKLDEHLEDEPSPDLGMDLDEKGQFYRFELKVESGFEDENEWGFSIGEYEQIENK